MASHIRVRRWTAIFPNKIGYFYQRKRIVSFTFFLFGLFSFRVELFFRGRAWKCYSVSFLHYLGKVYCEPVFGDCLVLYLVLIYVYFGICGIPPASIGLVRVFLPRLFFTASHIFFLLIFISLNSFFCLVIKYDLTALTMYFGFFSHPN